jgi:hypothetical protein
MITQKQIEQIGKIVGKEWLALNGNEGEVETLILGDVEGAKKWFIQSALGWNEEVIEFVEKTTPEERKELARLARIHALEKELNELKKN